MLLMFRSVGGSVYFLRESEVLVLVDWNRPVNQKR
jgi:hypothetical protein